MKYKISQIQQARIDFNSVFEVGLSEYLENEITAMTGFLVINIVAFDKFLQKQTINQEKKSFNQLLAEKYGQIGIELIKKLTL